MSRPAITGRHSVTGTAAIVITSAALAAALGACGSHDHGSAPHTTARSATASSTTNRTLSPSALGTATLAAMRAATSVHVVADSVANGSRAVLDIVYTRTASRGTIITNGTTLQLVSVDGAIYFQAPESFWRQHMSPAEQAANLAHVVGKFVKIPPSDSSFGQFAETARMDSFIAQVTAKANPAALQAADPKTVNGVAAIGIHDPADGSTIYVPEAGAPLPIEADVSSTAVTGVTRFSSWNVAQAITAPPADQVVDLPGAGH